LFISEKTRLLTNNQGSLPPHKLPESERGLIQFDSLQVIIAGGPDIPLPKTARVRVYPAED
jgi:hypothetical protein